MKIKKEDFVEIICSLIHQKRLHKELYKLGVDLINYESNYEKCFNILKKIVFNKKQIEMIDWWLYEDVTKVLFNEDKTIYKDLQMPNNLYDYIVTLK